MLFRLSLQAPATSQLAQGDSRDGVRDVEGREGGGGSGQEGSEGEGELHLESKRVCKECGCEGVRGWAR